MGKPLVDALPEINTQAFPKLLRHVFETGETHQARDVEVFLRRDETKEAPERVFLDFTYRRLLDDNREPYGIFVFAIDVTEKVLSKVSIQLEQVKLESVFANASAALAIMQGPQAIFEKVNVAYQSLFLGRPLIGKTVLEALPELKGQKFPDLLAETFSTGKKYVESEALARLRRSPEGAIEDLFFDQTYTRIEDKDGKPYGVLIHAIEVTERVRNREEFRAEKQKFEAIFYGSASPMVFFRGAEQIYEIYNRQYQELVPKRELLGKPLLEALPELKDTGFPLIIKKVFDTGEAITTYEELAPLINPLTGKLENRYFDSAISRVNDGAGNPYGVFVQATEVTDRVHTRKKIEDALSARDTFLSIASHELKTPIAGMKLQAQMIRRAIDRNDPNALTAARVRKLADQTNDGLDRMNRLVDDMLDISRIDGGRLGLNRELTDLGPLVRKAVERFSEELKAAGVEVRMEAKEGELFASVDQFRIEQVLTNLITNVIKYAPGAPVDVQLKRQQSFAQINFRDCGPGIPKKDCEKIFDRFERLVSASEVSGMGLGLYIVRQIIDMHGGKIFAEPDSSGGTRFVIELPLVDKS